LITQSRYDDLGLHLTTRDPDITRQANLVVTQIRHHSPVDVRVDISPKALAEAIKTGIETAALTGSLRKKAQLENRRSELELEIRAIEAENASNAQAHEFDLHKREREIDVREREVELERKRLELERARLELIDQQLELKTRAVKAAAEIVLMLHPNADEGARLLLVQGLVPSLLQLSELSLQAELTVTVLPPGLESGTPET
jgi:hypothetical protein